MLAEEGKEASQKSVIELCLQTFVCVAVPSCLACFISWMGCHATPHENNTPRILVIENGFIQIF